MAEQYVFHFKAVTGFGAVIDGAVSNSSPERVSRELIKQSLIPVRIWREQPVALRFCTRVVNSAKTLVRRTRTSSPGNAS